MESGLRELLDKIYELEGLVHLALKRDDSSKDFLRLITKKGKEVEELCNNLDTSSHSLESNNEEESGFSGSQVYSLDEYSIDEGNDSNEEDETAYEYRGSDTSEVEKTDPESVKQRGKLVFSINERFRFRKELFDNSDADFNTTLALVASMESYEEAEDYFINEEGFDPSNPVVKEFLEVIKRYFK